MFHCFKCAQYLGKIPRTLRGIIFGVAELIVTFVGVDVVADGHFGSWMIFVYLCHSFCEVEKGL